MKEREGMKNMRFKATGMFDVYSLPTLLAERWIPRRMSGLTALTLKHQSIWAKISTNSPVSLFEREEKGKSGNGGNNLSSEAKGETQETKIWAVLWQKGTFIFPFT